MLVTAWHVSGLHLRLAYSALILVKYKSADLELIYYSAKLQMDTSDTPDTHRIIKLFLQEHCTQESTNSELTLICRSRYWPGIRAYAVRVTHLSSCAESLMRNLERFCCSTASR